MPYFTEIGHNRFQFYLIGTKNDTKLSVRNRRTITRKPEIVALESLVLLSSNKCLYRIYPKYSRK